MIDALVVGAGPVGLAMAVELARYGLSVRIVEKMAERTDKSKALVIWSRTLELMDRMGCTQAFLDAGFKVKAANISTGEREIAHIALDGVASPYPFALMLPQSETERLLEEHLGSLGVRVERSVEMQQFQAQDRSVVTTLRLADGQEEVVESAWLLGCDGAHSAVRHQLKMPFDGETLTSNWILADVHLSGVPRPEEVEAIWHADGILVLFPISPGRYRVIADVRDVSGNSVTADPTLDDVQVLLDRRGPGGLVASSPIWLAAFHINERKVKEYRAGRVFLAGDAAHIHSPAGGQGMNTGIQDACNLAWKLALVQRGLCAEEPLLSSYSPERSAVGEEVLKNAGRLTAMAILRGEVKQGIRNRVASLVFGLSPVRRMAAEAMTEISIGYPDSPLNMSGGHVGGGPKTGERAPIREGERPVGAGGSPKFVLFAEADEAVAGLLGRYADLLEAEVREPFSEGGIWLVRPDGYVAVAVSNGELKLVGQFFESVLIRH